ncbi:MAG: acyl-CoA dehydrogenase [SAR202 cluster bacterium]|nr:acyl-CoA dehydrogenase [SAR202 cluster bacterium]
MLDFYNISTLMTPEEIQAHSTVRAFVEAEAVPNVRDWWERAEFPRNMATQMGGLGLMGATLPQEYGAAGLSSIAYGLIMYELERADSGLRSFASVQGSLVMYPIYRYGSEEQKRRYLPALAKAETIGCFGLTEHEGGSDPGAMKTTARKDGNGYVINGAKMWISVGDMADIAVIWARDEAGVVRGFIVPTDTPGFTVNRVQRQMSMRISGACELVMDNVRVEADSLLPGASGLSAPLSCLTQARYGIVWGVLGALEAVHHEASEFARHRSTFGKPIASRQLVQAKLADMLTGHTTGLMLAWRLGRLKDAGELTFAQVSLAKRHNVRASLNGARAAREILGGSGITLEYSAIRHMLNLETVDTYEGTHDIHTLVLGREITGMDAFK